jgi:hypothetical protein
VEEFDEFCLTMVENFVSSAEDAAAVLALYGVGE